MLAEIVNAEFEHVEPIAVNMRDADKAEIWAVGHREPLDAMVDGFNLSVKAWTILHDGAPIGMFGVSSPSLLGKTGIPWLLGTDEMLKIKRQFIRQSRSYIDEMLDLYPHLVNFVHVANTQSLRYIRLLGFDFYGPFIAGPDDAEFFKFERLADV